MTNLKREIVAMCERIDREVLLLNAVIETCTEHGESPYYELQDAKNQLESFASTIDDIRVKIDR